jgi:hypothetical protein
MATRTDLLTARIVLRAVLPIIKVLLEDDPKIRKKFEGVKGTVQFVADDPEEGPVGSHVVFDDLDFTLVHDIAENPDVTFRFSSLAKMNAMFAGKPVLPRIKGITNFGLLLKVFAVLLRLKLLMPDKAPRNDDEARLKVKLTLYMVSTGLSQLNKGGDPEMMKWTGKQPERIYQWSVEPEGIACYLKVKAGKTKAGRGYYTRRKPFVHMKFDGVEGALPVLMNQVDTVQAMTQGLVDNEGSPEYGGQVGDFMLKIAGMLS